MDNNIVAEKLGISKTLSNLDGSLRKIEFMHNIKYDLADAKELGTLIILAEYDIPLNEMKKYFKRRADMVQKVLNVSKENGLVFSGDAIEDSGSCLYFVFNLPIQRTNTPR